MKKFITLLIAATLVASAAAGTKDVIPLVSTNVPVSFSVGLKYQGSDVSTYKNNKWTGYGWANKETAVIKADFHNGWDLAVEDYLTQNQVNTSKTTKTKTGSVTTHTTTEASAGGFEVKPRYTFKITKKLDLGVQAGVGDSYGIHNTALVNKFYYISESRLIYHYNKWLNLRASYQFQSPFNELYSNWVNTVKIGPDIKLTSRIDLTLSYVNNFAGTQHGNGFESGLTYRF